MKAARFDYLRPASVAEAVAALAAEGARPLAGGQSLGPMLNLRLARPALLVDITGLAELRAVEDHGESVAFGAALTHAAFEDGRLPDPTAGVLAAVARGIAYRAVRNRGTIGGSLAHADPAADWPVTLTALGARLRLVGPAGAREIAIENFVRGAFETALEPQEIIAAVIVPRLSPDARWGYWKACRKVGEFAEAMAAVLIEPARGVHRLVIGATGGRAIVVPQAAEAIARPETLLAQLEATDLATTAADRGLHLAAIRRAVAAAQAQKVAA